MRVALLSPIAWRTPPRHHRPWEQIVSLLAEGLVERGIDVTLFATANSVTRARLKAVCQRPWEEDRALDPKVWECLHISELFEQALQFDLIHNHFDFLPLTYSALVDVPVVTTIHGFSSQRALPVYKKYNGKVYYVSISDADRASNLDYIATVHHGIDLSKFSFHKQGGDYLLYLGRIHHDKGTREAIEIAKRAGVKLIIAGIVQDDDYFAEEVEPEIDNEQIVFEGPAGPRRRNSLMGNARALIHPINFAEPFALSVVEAMACGTPTIAFNKGAMPELIENGENGFLVGDIDEAVIALKEVPRVSRRRCRDLAEQRFSASRMVDQYLRVYERILAAASPEAQRPWGFYEVLSDKPDHKVKRITVYPGKRLSLQRHQKRSEHWYLLAGEAIVTLDNQEVNLAAGGSVNIPRRSTHRIANPGTDNLVFVEVQTGAYFGEDDIERLEDDFGRA